MSGAEQKCTQFLRWETLQETDKLKDLGVDEGHL
jgi:hypothetical protein